MGMPRKKVEQRSLDFTIAQAELRTALRRLDTHVDRAWLEQAHAALERCAMARKDFISDDVWDFDLPRTQEDRALGPVFLRAKRAGIITKTDRVRPSVRSHLSGKPVWISNIYGGR
jgi:hypothetical protein